jgi:hypothetical protein
LGASGAFEDEPSARYIRSLLVETQESQSEAESVDWDMAKRAADFKARHRFSTPTALPPRSFNNAGRNSEREIRIHGFSYNRSKSDGLSIQ